MPEFNYESEPLAPYASLGQPTFFKRVWGGNPQEPFARDGMVYISMEPAEPVTIYGYSIDSPYPEDKDQQRYAWDARQAFLAWCYSVMEPRGEPGFVPLAEVTTITRDEFEQAAAARWQKNGATE